MSWSSKKAYVCEFLNIFPTEMFKKVDKSDETKIFLTYAVVRENHNLFD